MQGLIKELRINIEAYHAKQAKLEKRQERLEMAEAAIRMQANEMAELRGQLQPLLDAIQRDKAERENTRIRIKTDERINLNRLAKIYTGMKPKQAGKMLAALYAQSGGREDDVVKILRYMKEKSAGKILAAMGDVALVAELTEKLKRIQEDEG